MVCMGNGTSVAFEPSETILGRWSEGASTHERKSDLLAIRKLLLGGARYRYEASQV